MLTGGMAPQYGKENLGPYSSLRWGSIANRLVAGGSPPDRAANIANTMTREAVARRLQANRQNQYIQQGDK